MAITKPGKVVGGFTWTGKRWVKNPERMSDKVALEKEIRSQKSRTNSEREKDELKARTTYPGKYARMSNPVTQKPMSQKEKNAAKASTYNKNTTAKRMGTKPADKPKPIDTPSGSRPTPSGSSTTKKTAKTPAKKAATVSQSNTEWVKKGDVVNGKTVTKGYVAQKGKPERKVTANVKLVVDTARGKAGSKVSYTKGRATKKGK